VKLYNFLKIPSILTWKHSSNKKKKKIFFLSFFSTKLFLRKILAPQLVTAENVAEIFQLTTNTTKLPSVKDYCVEFFSKFELTAAVEKSAFQRLPKLLQDSLMSAGNAKVIFCFDGYYFDYENSIWNK
jgi:hypothetical protein